MPVNNSADPLSSISIGNNGNILAAFGKGAEVPVATIPLSIFANPNGLKQLEVASMRQPICLEKFF